MIVSKEFYEAVRSAGQTSGVVRVTDETIERILKRIAPVINHETNDLYKENTSISVSTRQGLIWASLASKLVSGEISESQFCNIVKYDKWFGLESELYSSRVGGQAWLGVQLRKCRKTLPHLVAWEDGSWGWEAVVGRSCSPFDLELQMAGQQKMDPTTYLTAYDQIAQKEDNDNKKKGCFIATVCYGSYSTPEVISLRNYRDKVLMHSACGRLFVNGYYWLSPGISVWLGKHKRVAMCVRFGILNQLVRFVNRNRSI